MDFQLDLDWDAAEALAGQGRWIRRWGWVDRWWYLVAGVWILKPAVGEPRVIRATDYSPTEFAASDWTTMWPDQNVCLVVPVPDPIPQPSPGGPIVRYYNAEGEASRPRGGFRNPGSLHGEQLIPNPFSDRACSVEIVANWLDDGLAVNGIEVTRPGGMYYAGYSPLFSYRFILPAGRPFTIAAVDHYGGIWQYGLAITFTP